MWQIRCYVTACDRQAVPDNPLLSQLCVSGVLCAHAQVSPHQAACWHMCTLTYACVGCEWVLNTLATLVGVHTALPEKHKSTTQVQADTVVTHLSIQKLICTA
jgi:hypothetical protein